MRRLVYLSSASRDLLGILDYIVEESRNVELAERFTAELRRQCLKLSRLPGTLGTARPEIRSDLRSVPYRGYVILFRYVEDRFEVVNVIEGHRDVIRHVDQDEAPTWRA